MPIADHSSPVSLILRPSWLSGLIAVIAGLVVSIGVIVVFSLSSSDVQQQLLIWQHSQPTRALTTPDQVLAQSDKPTFSGSWPLLVFWSGLGLVVYFVATNVARSIHNAETFRESLSYVNVKKQSLIRIETEVVLVKTVVAVLWVVFTVMFFKKVIPYSITAAHASAADVLSLQGLTYAFLSFMSIAVSVQLHTIFLRLLAGRVRIFTSY